MKPTESSAPTVPVEAMPFPACVIAVDGSEVLLNDAAARLLGLAEILTRADALLNCIHYDDRAEIRTAVTKAATKDMSIDRVVRIRSVDGRYSRCRVIGQIVRETSTAPAFWFCQIFSAADASGANESIDILGRLHTTLAGADYEANLGAALRIIVHEFSDIAVCYTPATSGDYEIFSAAGLTPEYRKTLSELFDALPSGGYLSEPIIPTQAMLEKYIASTPVRQELHLSTIEHGIALLIDVGQERPALVFFGRRHSPAAFSNAERRLAELMSAQIGAYAARMNADQRDREIVQGFQRASLPVHLPSVAGYHFEGFYEFGAGDRQFGGDWYDALRLADGRIVLSIGDVAGSGLAASVTMASMRQVIRGVAQVYADPRTILEAADRTLKNEYPEGIVTAFVGVLDPIAHTLTYMNAGHPHPYLRQIDGMLEELGVTGLPLGLRTRDHGENVTIEFYDKSMLVLYTNGLIDAGRDIIEGYSRFQTLLENISAGPRGEMASLIYQGMHCERSMDDVAICVVTADRASLGHSNVVSDTMFARWTFDTGDENTAALSRSAFADFLRRAGFRPDDVFASEMIFGELLSNVVRYANGPVEIVVDRRDPAAAVLHMLDQGPGFLLIPALPGDILSEHGRGLFLISALSRGFNVTKRIGRGSHARAVLPGTGKPTGDPKSHNGFVRGS